MKYGKKYIDSVKSFDTTKQYDVAEALDIVLATSKAKFDETIEFHTKLGVDPKQADQQVRGVIVLPNGTGKTMRVLVIAKGEKADIAQQAGADYVGAEDLVAKIQKDIPFVKDRMLGAITNADRYNLWDKYEKFPRTNYKEKKDEE